MGLAKRLKIKPREVAQAIVAKLDVSRLCDPPEIAGPGFINLRLAARLARRAGGRRSTPTRAWASSRAAQPETVVVDYSAPNLAKEMHVGHLRRRSSATPSPGCSTSPGTRLSARTMWATGGRSLGCCCSD